MQFLGHEGSSNLHVKRDKVANLCMTTWKKLSGKNGKKCRWLHSFKQEGLVILLRGSHGSYVW